MFLSAKFSLHIAEEGKFGIVLFETVECLLAVCRDCVEDKLCETPPLSEMLNKQRRG
jgi:hypothetical protein